MHSMMSSDNTSSLVLSFPHSPNQSVCMDEPDTVMWVRLQNSAGLLVGLWISYMVGIWKDQKTFCYPGILNSLNNNVHPITHTAVELHIQSSGIQHCLCVIQPSVEVGGALERDAAQLHRRMSLRLYRKHYGPSVLREVLYVAATENPSLSYSQPGVPSGVRTASSGGTVSDPRLKVRNMRRDVELLSRLKGVEPLSSCA